jgi:hypothetical protein
MSATAVSRDRRQLLLAPEAAFNGIDYVEVAANQTELYVHFLNTVAVAGTLTGKSPVMISGGEVIQSVAVDPIDQTTAFGADSEGRPILTLSVPAPGDFSTYQLAISSKALDPFFASVPFSFKASCPTTLDCATPPPTCPAPAAEPVAIDYLAKDFSSFTKALSEFSAGRYPAWVERSEADLGMVLMEALAAFADELSYLQDRVSAESSIVTATQRLSVLRHARLVDYEPAPATVATTVLQIDVNAAGPITTPLHCRAVAADGSAIDFEVGEGLADPKTGAEQPIEFPVDPRWNRYQHAGGSPGDANLPANLPAYWWDDSQICLAAGATELYVSGHGHAFYPGQQLLLETTPNESADPPVRELIELSRAAGRAPVETSDELRGEEVTQLFLASPTTLDHDLSATALAGNLVPAVQGLRTIDWFYVPHAPEAQPQEQSAQALAAERAGAASAPGPTPLPAVVRFGANWTPQDPLADYRYCLAGNPLAWISKGSEDGDTAVPAIPELVLTDRTAPEDPKLWVFSRWLLDAEEDDRSFTLTPERYSPVLTSDGATFYDYDGDEGTTIRFGDGVFGAAPDPGTLFSALYRVGGGLIGNVPADTIVNVVPGQAQSALVISCTNPLPASGGTEAETIAQVADRAPQKFAAEPLRVVQAGDYVAAAQSLPFVQQAGTTFRWTGSWLTVFTAANPIGSEQPSLEELEELTELLDRRRLAGYESYVLPPRYVSIDLSLVVCAEPSYFASDVQEAVLARLRPGPLPGGGYGFFDHSQWSFGQPLEPSALFAAVQSCIGVAGVYAAEYRERGVQLEWTELPATPLSFAPDQLLRVGNDPSRPEAGSLAVSVKGGK